MESNFISLFDNKDAESLTLEMRQEWYRAQEEQALQKTITTVYGPIENGLKHCVTQTSLQVYSLPNTPHKFKNVSDAIIPEWDTCPELIRVLMAKIHEGESPAPMIRKYPGLLDYLTYRIPSEEKELTLQTISDSWLEASKAELKLGENFIVEIGRYVLGMVYPIHDGVTVHPALPYFIAEIEQQDGYSYVSGLDITPLLERDGVVKMSHSSWRIGDIGLQELCTYLCNHARLVDFTKEFLGIPD